jgi:uncharacterized protein YlzI (FlbEa/FlbD family)
MANVELFDNRAGTTVYVNPDYVVTLRPDPDDPLHVTDLKLRDGETLVVRGDPEQVAEKLGRLQ